MIDLADNQEFQAQLLESIIDPKIACTNKSMRARTCPTKIKTLYHLYQLQKNVKSGKWSSIYQGKTAICKNAKISKKHFSEFVNSADFCLFGDVIHRKGTTNIYQLKKWVIEFFSFFERKGMMKNFRENFNEWKRSFCKRLRVWLLPLLRSGHSLNQILMNKLSTRKTLKGDDPKTLKGDGIKPTGSLIKPSGSKSKQEFPILPSVQGFLNVSRELVSCFSLKEGDVNMLLSSYSLNDIKGGLRIRQSYGTSYQPNSPVALFRSCIKKHKNLKRR